MSVLLVSHREQLGSLETRERCLGTVQMARGQMRGWGSRAGSPVAWCPQGEWQGGGSELPAHSPPDTHALSWLGCAPAPTGSALELRGVWPSVAETVNPHDPQFLRLAFRHGNVSVRPLSLFAIGLVVSLNTSPWNPILLTPGGESAPGGGFALWPRCGQAQESCASRSRMCAATGLS